MLKVFLSDQNRWQHIDAEAGSLPAQAVWFDLYQPTRAEEVLVEKVLGAEMPTREEMQEIEASSRLYQENGVHYMTATVMAKADTPHPESAAITFILARQRLVTLRYVEPRPFRTFSAYIERQPAQCASGATAMIGLLEAIIDRLADILERVGVDMDSLLREIFEIRQSGKPQRLSGGDYQQMMAVVGRNQYLTAKARESLISLGRMMSFMTLAEGVNASKELRSRAKTLIRDAQSLTDHTAFISSNITFLLDALLGMINLEQNSIIKIFSVAAVVFLPPTLVASIYGMNFQVMPELSWKVGYPWALVLMVISAILPYLYFKRRGWL
ncbi:MAG: magnesium transporter CorA family protein [Gammaproteobacteria bacterium]